MTTPADYFDVNSEPTNFQGRFSPDPTEQTVPPIDGHEDEISTIRDSVHNEPAWTSEQKQSELKQWIADKRAKCTLSGNLAVTLLAALAAGPLAIVGVFMTGRQTIFAILYGVLFAPVIEELLKQSGMIFLLEKKPYRLFSGWQFIIAAIISAALFSTIENLIYIHVYVDPKSLNDPLAFACFRWTVCMLLHISCSVIASLGLIRVWKRQLMDGRAADLAHAFVPFAAAMVLHGAYNLAVALINPTF